MLLWQASSSLVTLFKVLAGSPEKSTHFLRFVGGSVRDFLLGVPWKDVDLATSLSPEEIIKRLQIGKISYFTAGISHGTVTAVVEGNLYEITTLRRDMASDGRHAIVAFTEDWQQDALRRDFTLNALYMDWTGRLYDFVGGQEDLYGGRVRFVGNPEERIQEDFLRILRLFRMFSFYGKVLLEDETLKAVQRYAPKIKSLSRERIHAEFLRLLEAPNPEDSLQLMKSYGVLKEISEDLHIPSFFGDLLRIEDQLQEQNPLLRLSALLLTSPNKSSSYSLKTFLIKKKEIKDILAILSWKEFLISQEPLVFSRALLYQMKLPLYRNVMILKSVLLSQGKREISLLLKEILKKAEDENETLVFPLTGKDLLPLGIEPGPYLGKLLKKTEDFWIEKDCSLSREECLSYAREKIP